MQIDNWWSQVFRLENDKKVFSEKFVPEFFLRPEVPADVVENVKIVKQLLTYSFYEHKFYDIALHELVTTMEMALRIRFEQLNGKQTKKVLEKLFQWFEDRNYFEVSNHDFLVALRTIRNELAHPRKHGSGGASTRQLMEYIIDLVNGLYEEPLLRKQRMDLLEQFISRLADYKRGIKCSIGDKDYLVFNAWPAFINNKIQPEEVHFYFHYFFNIPATTAERSNWIIPPYGYFKGNCLQFNQDKITLEGPNGSQLIISEISEEKELIAFQHWTNKYEKYCHPANNVVYINEELTNTSSKHLREFHKL